MTTRLTFTKAERLTGKTNIERLFAEGKTINEYPLRVIYRVPEEDLPFPLRLLIAVPKRKFRNATDRNRIRRRIREAYRLNRGLMEPEEAGLPGLHVAIIYNADKADLPYGEIDRKMKASLDRLQKFRISVVQPR